MSLTEGAPAQALLLVRRGEVGIAFGHSFVQSAKPAPGSRRTKGLFPLRARERQIRLGGLRVASSGVTGSVVCGGDGGPGVTVVEETDFVASGLPVWLG